MIKSAHNRGRITWYTKDMQKTLTKHPKTAPITTTKPTKKVQYNDRFITSELTQMLEELMANEDITSRAQLFKYRPYSSAKFSYWKRRYETNTSIQEKLKKIEEIIESRLVERGLQGKAIPMTIFLLKNYYGYTDQYQHKVDNTVTFKVTRGQPPKVVDSVTLKQLPKQQR